MSGADLAANLSIVRRLIQAAAHRANRLGEAVEHGLGAELVVQGVAVHAQLPRGLRDVALAGGHGRHDVFPLESLDCLRQRDAVPDQFSNDGVQAIVDAYHVVI
jgi:hypothetical protein